MANRFLNNITINDEYTLPSADGTTGQVITTDGAGALSFADAAASDAIVLTVKNISGGSLSKGTVVHPSPSASPPSGNVIEVIAADKSAASTMPAIGVLNETLSDDGEGECIAFGTVKDIDTSSFSASDPIYVGASGGFTTTKPSGTDLIQKIGIVVKVHASNGSIKVFGANRTNDVPNIPQDQLWLGNSSGVATATSHTVENISNVTTSTKTDGQALVWDATNNYWKNGDVAAAGGGGGGSMSAEIDQHTGNGTTDAFSLTTASTDADAVQVYLDGVYQVKTAANYSVSGSTVTFVDPPTSGTAIEFVHFINTAASSLTNKIFTGDGTTSDFDLVDTVSDENYTFVFIQGIYQEKSAYSISGSTITFSSPPTSGYSIEVMIFGTVSISGNSGISWVTPEKTANFTAVASEGYFVNTTSAAITVTLPSSPTAGNEVSIVDYAGTADTNNITITSSDNINGATDDLLINYERGGVSMVYVDATQGWIAYNAANETATALASNLLPLTVDYLVVAGGGGGGSVFNSGYGGGGGGGAGGLRTSYGSITGGGGSAESSLSLSSSTNYTVTVGPGGAGGGESTNNPGSNGDDSVFNTITSKGGGGGGNWGQVQANAQGLDGGSGGGGARSYSGGAALTSPVVMGYAGGDTGGNSGGGGGGGASEIGFDASLHSGVDDKGGNGGDGLEVNITGGTGNYYAGGGAGGAFGSSPPQATGGTGGGGNGGWNSGYATAGTPNTGGGGGAGANLARTGQSGGSGVVILRYPNAYSISETTSGGNVLSFTTATDGSDNVTTFTAGDGTIEFS